MDTKKFLTIRQTAATGLISEHRLRILVTQGKCPGIKNGNRFMVNVTALSEQLDVESHCLCWNDNKKFEERESFSQPYDLSLSALEAMYLREELNWAANNHRKIAKEELDLAVPGFSGHIKISEWHEDKARICEELAERVLQALGD